MNTRSLFPALLIAVAPWFSNPAAAAVPLVDGQGVAARTVCPTTLQTPSVYHFDKIIFKITGNLVAAKDVDQQHLSAMPLNTELDIKVGDNPRSVADLKGKVLTFLGASTTPSATGIDNRKLITIVDVEYAATLCPKAQ